ncbi:MAG: hypothetical protein RL685_593 [Pseudomonadota bacterium]|jgi:amino acid adenylation domain-containing protein/non-ribosomal peptide synthase protein (TIGR01720 family)
MNANVDRRKENIETIAAVSPLQQGILFHSLRSRESDPYFYQVVFQLSGVLDVARLTRAWQLAVDRHQVLRAEYRWEETATPLQVIFKKRAVEIEQLDWRAHGAAEQFRELQHLLEAERVAGFDFRHASGVRLRLIQLGEGERWLTWHYHHVTLDGWSMALVVGDALRFYQELQNGADVRPRAALPYTAYVEWLQKQQQTEAVAYWKQLLAGFDDVTPLPRVPRRRAPGFGEKPTRLGVEQSELVREAAKAMGVTLNTLVQGAWALLLGRYSDVPEVVFGATVAGRAAPLAGIEDAAGLFINTLPVRVKLEPRLLVQDWLRGIQQQNLDSRRYEHTPLIDVRRCAGLAGDEALFGSVLVFDNYPIDEVLRQQPGALRVQPLRLSAEEGAQASGRNNYELTLSVSPGRQLSLTLAYHAEWFEHDHVTELAEQLEQLLLALCRSPHECLANIGLDACLAQAFEASPATTPPRATMLEAFAAHATRTPGALAVAAESRRVTYAELEVVSDELAWQLRERGVSSDARVALCAERSIEFIAGLLGILKAGAAYVPLDAKLPARRLSEFARESGARWLVSSQAAASIGADVARGAGAELLLLDAAQALGQPRRFAVPRIHPDQAAYIIFTSGSTGRPKGVVVSHGALARYTDGLLQRLELEPGASMGMISTIGADLGHTVLFGALCSGAPLHLIAEHRAFDPDAFAEYMSEQRVAVLKIVPSHLKALLEARQPERALPEHALIVGGEASDWALLEQVRALRPGCRVINHYGPTETTVGVSTFAVGQGPTQSQSVPIGRPLPGVELYVLDRALNRVPPGVAGELYIGGDRLARGYQGSARLSADRFVPSPFGAVRGARLYRTGDRVRRGRDGELEFLGRADRQVKIRGYRVELGEIEGRLLEHPAVSQALLITRTSAQGALQLVGYVASERPAEPLAAELLEQLGRALPEYMVPSRIFVLQTMPLTENGKLDRKALPWTDPVASTPALSGSADPPVSPVEQSLVEVWKEVLRVEHVNPADNFYALGGDSILSLQVIARARRRGLKITPKQLFEHQTVRALAVVAERTQSALQPARAAAPSAGNVALLPVQARFFGRAVPDRQRFNQSVLLTPREPVDAARLELALRQLVEHHPSLRLAFREVDGVWLQSYQELASVRQRWEKRPLLWTRSLQDPCEIEGLADEAQGSLSLEQPPLLRAVLLSLADGSQRLLLALHHLIVDGVSWRVLLEDLQAAYQQLGRGQSVSLPVATSPLEIWASRLSEYARSPALLGQTEYWRRLLAEHKAAELPCDRPEGANLVKHQATVTLRLSRTRTAELLQEAGSAYRTQVNDLLLTALSRALCGWTRQPSVLVELEGHGREDLFPGVDLSRTVGWFTSLFPVRLQPVLGTEAAALAASVKAIKEQLRGVPDRGLGYGVLRHLATAEARSQLEGLVEPRITFNYLGQFDQSFDERALFVPATEATGRAQSESSSLGSWLSINGQVYGGELSLTFSYSSERYRRETVEAMAESYRQELEAVVEHCVGGASGATPSDFPLARVSQVHLDELKLFWDDVEDIYPLSPMQQGLLMHTLLEPGSGIYLMQHDHSIEEAVDLASFKQAWQHVAQRHAVLRTSFVWNDEGMLQVVQRHAQVAVEISDLRQLSAEQQEARLQQSLDRELQEGFDLQRAPLWKVRLARLAERKYRFVFSNHHILMDAWSRALLLQDVFAAYEKLVQKAVPAAAAPPRYRDFIAWLDQSDPDRAVDYWRRALTGFETATPLPWDRAPRKRSELSVVADEAIFWSKERSAVINQLAQTQQLTVNTFVQAAWALTLARYSGQQDVLFGVTVAGRPVELPAMEKAVGLFINSIPLRVRLPRADVTTRQWLLSLLDQNVSMRQYEHLPLVTIQSNADVARGQALFHSLFVFENAPVDVELIQSAQAMSAAAIGGRTHTNYPITVVVYPGARLGLHLSYDARLFEKATIVAMLGELERLLQELVERFQSPAAALQLLPAGEREKLMQLGTGAQGEYSLAQGYVQRFEQRAALHPERVAAGCLGNVLTYGQLNAEANRMAHALRARGVGLDARVALLSERNLGLLQATVGVLKAGAGYVPLDPRHPPRRIAEILSQSGARVLLSVSAFEPLLRQVQECLPAELRPELVWLDRLERAALPEHNPPVAWHPHSLAYMIFTSGSTGKPKGVVVEQAGMLNNQLSKLPWLGLGEGDVIAQTASQCFDISVWQLLTAPLCGARVQIVPDEIAHDPQGLLQHVSETGITILECVPSLISALLETCEALAPGLRVLISTGEALAPELTRRWFERHPGVPLANAYGPAECSDDVAMQRIEAPLPASSDYSPIGAPTDNNRLYVLDSRLELVPIGVVGEVFVAGVGVGRGYQSEPRRSAAAFVPNPFAREPGERLYRTGDLARYRADGMLECVGRTDHQVKIRGYRIELGEIEAQLRQHVAVADAVVTVHESASGKRLLGYVAAKGVAAKDAPEGLTIQLSAQLAAVLPEYMLPSHLTVLDELPVTPNGKVDRKALPEPEWLGKEDYVAPETELGRSLAAIWRKALGVGRVGARDSFFELGGNSLLATQVVSRIRQELRLNVPLRLMFEGETLADLERSIATEAYAVEPTRQWGR